jgi:HK97 family phage portal protein
MGVLSRFGAALGVLRGKSAGGVALPTQGYLPSLSATPSAAGLLISQATAMTVSTVYACVTIRAQDVARCTPRLFRRRRDGSREQVLDHPLCPIFDSPNRQQTWFEWMEQQQGAYLLRGNAYAAKKRDGRGRIKELVPINPDAVLVLEGYDGGVFYNVNRVGLWQIAMLREFPASISQDDILHLRGLSFNALVGASTIGLARDSIGVAMGLDQQAARWMANGSRPSVILQAKKKMSDEAATRLKRQWNDNFAGLNGTGGTVVLEDGLEAKALQLTSVDLEFIAQRNFGVLDVARFYRVPPHKLGVELMRGINVVQVDQDYVNNTVMPDVHRWEQKFSKCFGLAAQGLEMDMDETVLLRADIQTRYAAARVALLSGWVTVNEVRAGEDLPPVEGGDVVFHPLNMAALGSDLTGTAPDGAGRPASGHEGVPPADATDGGEPATGGEKAQVDRLTRWAAMTMRYPETRPGEYLRRAE